MNRTIETVGLTPSGNQAKCDTGRRSGLSPIPVVVLTMAAAVALTSCKTTGSSGKSDGASAKGKATKTVAAQRTSRRGSAPAIDVAATFRKAQATHGARGSDEAANKVTGDKSGTAAKADAKDTAKATVKATNGASGKELASAKPVSGTGSSANAKPTTKVAAKPKQSPAKRLADLRKKAARLVRATRRPKAAASSRTMTLREAVLRVSKLHPSVRAAWSRHVSSRARSKVERGGLFPTVGVSGETGPQYYASPTQSGLTGGGGRRDGDVLWRSEGTGVATQLIYDGWQTWNRYRQAKASAKAARYRVDNAKQEVALAAIAAYIDVLRNRQLVDIARRNVGVHRVIVGGVSQLTRQGRADQADVSQAVSRLALSLSNLELRVGQLRDAEARFIATLNLRPVGLAPVNLPVALRTISLQKALDVAQKINPTIGVARSEVKSRRHGVKATEGLFVPRLEAEVSGRVGHNLDGVRGRTDDLRALLRLTWNLYRGGSDRARRDEAIANLAAARHDVSEARRLVRERVRRAYAIMASNSRRLVPLRQRFRASQGVVGAYSEQFRLGRRSLLDRLDAQNELFVAQAEYVDIQFTVLFNYYTLLAATGELLSSFNIKTFAALDGMRHGRGKRGRK